MNACHIQIENDWILVTRAHYHASHIARQTCVKQKALIVI